MLYKLPKVVIVILLPIDVGECYVVVCAYQLNHRGKKKFFFYSSGREKEMIQKELSVSSYLCPVSVSQQLVSLIQP